MSDATQIAVHHTISDIPAADWDACAGTVNPFVSHAFLSALEASGCTRAETGWQPYHLSLTPQGATAPDAVLPLYLKGHSMGEYVFDHAWADAYERAGGHYYPKLQSSIPFTPATGPRLMARPGAMAGAQSLLLQGAIAATNQLGLSSCHITFMTEAEAHMAEAEGFLLRTDQQFHWFNRSYGDFSGFLSVLSSRKRKQVRKERQTVLDAGITFEKLSGHAITEAHWDHFFDFYLDTGARKWGQPYLNRAFFSEVSARMADCVLLILAKREGRYIAGALNFIGTDTLYGRYWGCLEDHPCLHFETCYYQAIDYAIEHGLARVEAGAQGPHKVARGYEPVKTYSAHYLREAAFRDAVDRYLRQEHRSIDAEIAYFGDHTPFRKV